MQTTQFPLPKAGIDKLSDETSLKKGAWRTAVNVDISRNGQVGVREGFTRISTGEYHSIWYSTQLSKMFASCGGTIYTINTTTGVTTPVLTTPSNSPVSYCEYNGNVYAVNLSGTYIMPSGSTVMAACGYDAPAAPVAMPSATGGLAAGKYAVAISIIAANGEESATSEVQVVTLTSNGGIQLTSLPQVAGGKVVVYVTGTNGDVLYEYAQPPASLSSHLISAAPTGAEVRTQYMTRFPGGHIVRWQSGRLLVASGDTLWYSDPFRPHLIKPNANFVQFVGKISFVEALPGGVYVGDDRGVWFLDGTDPTKFAMHRVSSCRAIPGTSVVVPNEHFNDKQVPANTPVAVWLCTSGYAVGIDGGIVVEPNADIIRVPLSTKGRSSFAIRKGRKQILTLVSTPTDAAGLAQDSTI